MSSSTKASVETRESKTGNSPSHANKTNVSGLINSPIDQIFVLQRMVGNREVERLLKSGVIQDKLTIGQAGAKPVFRPQTAAQPSAPAIRAKLKVREPDDKVQQGADQVAELTENGDGSISPFAAAQSRRPVGNLQRLYGNQPVLQMRKGSDVPPAASVPLRPGESGILQRRCACGGAAGMSGECEECSKKRRLGLQAKLKVNEPGDIYEQEADRIADRVMATPAHPAINGAPPRIQRFSGQPNGLDTAPASVDRTLASPGRPVEPALRQDMEQRFGHDFSRVRVHADTQAAVAQRRAVPAAADTAAAPAHVPDRAPGTRLRPSQVPLRMTPTGDRTEAQARRFASTGRWATPVTPGGTYSISGYGVRALEHGVAGPGSPLDAQTRRRFEPELGLDLAPVRVHTDATAAASGRALGAKAYTVGSHIVFSPGRYQPATEGGRELLAHELAHVAQQAASGAPVVAALPDFWDVAGALTVGPGTYAVAKALDVSALDVLEAGARFVLGDTLFALLQSFLRGFKDGLEHAPSRQVDAISDRFDNFGVRDAYEVAEGFTIGVIKGLGQALWNLGKALITLLELPLKIQKFLMDLPQLAQRYAPRIAQLVTEGSRLLKRLGEAFARDPAGTMAQLDRVLESARTFVLANVWNRGREAAKDVLGFLEKSWDDIGEFFGNITGQILFEVLLAVGTDLIGNIVKEAALLVGRVATRAVEAVKAIGGLIGRVLKWLEGLVGRFVANTGEVLVAIRDWLRTLLKVFDEIAPEMEGAVVGPKGTGVTVPVPKPTVIESRIVRQPGSPTLADITPPKVHPSNVGKELPPRPELGKAPFDEPLSRSEKGLTREQLRQRHILQEQAERQRAARPAAKQEATTGQGRREVTYPWQSNPRSTRAGPVCTRVRGTVDQRERASARAGSGGDGESSRWKRPA